jgi:hypothetical protein
MRLPLLGFVLALASCGSFPTPNDPRVHLSPYFAKYRLRGDVAMQNNPGTGPENNASQSIDSLGQGHHGDDVGLRADIGDGFSGIRIEYYRLDLGPSGSGALSDELGALQTGDVAAAEPRMDEWRLGWSQSVLDGQVAWRGNPVRVQGAAGATWANRDMDLDIRTTDGLRSQNVDLGGDAFYGTALVRATMRQVSLDVSYSLCPWLQSGDWDGLAHDFETRLSYAVPFQDVTLFAGYRWSTFQGEGTRGGLRHEADFVLDGFQLGVTVTF